MVDRENMMQAMIEGTDPVPSHDRGPDPDPDPGPGQDRGPDPGQRRDAVVLVQRIATEVAIAGIGVGAEAEAEAETAIDTEAGRGKGRESEIEAIMTGRGTPMAKVAKMLLTVPREGNMITTIPRLQARYGLQLVF